MYNILLPQALSTVPLAEIQLLMVAEFIIVILLSPTIYNSVFYGNGSDITNSTSSSTTGGNNFSENYTETGFTALDADPFYRSSDPKGADEEWFTDDDGLKPKIGSPIIDAGDATKLPSDTQI